MFCLKREREGGGTERGRERESVCVCERKVKSCNPTKIKIV